jgi:NADPH-dependent F420 reductase
MGTRIAILGGTGSEGRGLAARFGKSGVEVIVGSRSAEKAARVVEQLRTALPDGRFVPAANTEAARAAGVVFVTVPFVGLETVIESYGPHLAGKIVVDTVVPIRVEDGHFGVEPVAEGSAAEYFQARLPLAKVVSAFKNQSAETLLDLGAPLDGDVVVCGSDEEARAAVAALVRCIPGLRPVDGGELRNARALEQMTALLLDLNRRHRARTSFRLTGL